MGIRFACEHCGGLMHVKSKFAGKRALCNHCQGRLVIPLASTVEKDASAPAARSGNADTTPATQRNPRPSTTDVTTTPVAASPSVAAVGVASVALPVATAVEPPPDPIAESPALQWFVLPAGSLTQYGPAVGEVFREWIATGRVAADSLVWRQDWPEWRRANEVLPQLVPTQLPMKAEALDPRLNGDVAPARPAETDVIHRLAGGQSRRSVYWPVVLLCAAVAALAPVVWYVLTHRAVAVP